MSASLKYLLILLARAWQLGPSRVLPPTCRYQPSCSEYAPGMGPTYTYVAAPTNELAANSTDRSGADGVPRSLRVGARA